MIPTDPCVCGFEYKFHLSDEYFSRTADYLREDRVLLKNNKGDALYCTGNNLPCYNFKMDNLSYIEKLAKEKGLV